MGRGKSWSRDESEAVAKAWRIVSNTFSSPRDQGGKRFVHTLHHQFLQLAPASGGENGRWSARSPTAVKTHFDAISEEAAKFNRALRTVINLPTTVNVKPQPEAVLRAVVAVHTRVIDIPQLDFNNLPQTIPDWKLFSAWKVLSGSPQFAPKAFFTWITDNSKTVPSDLFPLSPDSGSVERKFTKPVNSFPSLSAQHAAPANSANSTDPARHFQRVEYNVDGTTADNAEQVYKKRRTRYQADRNGKASKSVPVVPEVFTAVASAIHHVADSLNAVAAAQEERNAISLLSMPTVELTEHRKVFLDLLVEKHMRNMKSSLDVGQTDVQNVGIHYVSPSLHERPNGADHTGAQPSVDLQEPSQFQDGTNPSSVSNEHTAG
ncbi:hypothetical protein FGB62_11g011 [Gracilaria domingensis]|nr:hypothetical protein FGB62_11g011 [Gracilaria domingensis]